MKKALLLHGIPEKTEYFDSNHDSPSNAHWLPWLQKELLMRDYLAQTPEFPEPYLPQYKKWVTVFQQFDIDADTLLVGHSCGAGFLLRYLSENKIHIDTLVLVAPWIDPTHELDTGFFDFEIDSQISERVRRVILFSSLTDDEVVLESVEIIRKKISQIQVSVFPDAGHFCFEDMGTRAFPELLESIINE